MGEVADYRGGPLQGGEEGLRVVSHLHSPIKFLYFETNGMRQNRVRRVSLVTGGTTNSIGTKTEVVNGEEGSLQVSTQTQYMNCVLTETADLAGCVLELKCRVSLQ